jgi:hypothetical protein
VSLFYAFAVASTATAASKSSTRKEAVKLVCYLLSLLMAY